MNRLTSPPTIEKKRNPRRTLQGHGSSGRRAWFRAALFVAVFSLAFVGDSASARSARPDYVAAAVATAGANASEIERAWESVPEEQRTAMAFLIEHMPPHDLRDLSADFLLEHVDYAHRSWQTSPWKAQVSRELFLNGILPYFSVTEPRDRWRPILRDTCLEIVAGAQSPSEAAVRLNQEIYPHFGVIYSRERSRNDQCVTQVLKEQKATCTGLSILLTNACRSVGVPARLVGTPLWADSSGNHSWVEIWDGEWFYTGAAEPAGDRLNDVWFGGRAARAKKDVPAHAIYAVSYEESGTLFPLSWDPTVRYVHAVNVTDRYQPDGAVGPGTVPVRFVAYNHNEERVPTRIEVRDATGAPIFSGVTRGDRSDMNDHLTAHLEPGRDFAIHIHAGSSTEVVPCRTSVDGEPMTLRLNVHAANGWGRPIGVMEGSNE